MKNEHALTLAWLRESSKQVGAPNHYELAADAIEALQRDAARYRWARQSGQKQDYILGLDHYEDDLDAAIDAAMKDAP